VFNENPSAIDDAHRLKPTWEKRASFGEGPMRIARQAGIPIFIASSRTEKRAWREPVVNTAGLFTMAWNP
jgi:hypothetical protein